MVHRKHPILAIEPVMVPVSDGSWLAVARPDAVIRAGAMAGTEAEARLRFADALRRIADALAADCRTV